ncbi:MAG TPA: vitamin B12 dependent-methionine synthase activation domain-containing protein [Candidatus Sumerlaeota bacterium]|nr:vitamin B12 dependent-methionine synthase activation domain-containing protein [Candidatus Sumerlaeota bacterium]
MKDTTIIETRARNFGSPPRSVMAGEWAELAHAAWKIARPRALICRAGVEARGDDTVTLSGQVFTSRLLRCNVGRSRRVFAYAATCGEELASWAAAFDDPLDRYWADQFCEKALWSAVEIMNRRLARIVRPQPLAHMSPGSLPDWPLEQQRPLFELLGGSPLPIGVALTDSLLMVPVKSVSGIAFPSKDGFSSCRLCPREGCPGRRVPFEPSSMGHTET